MARSSFYYKEIKRNYHEAKEAILSLYKKNTNRDGYRPMTFKLRQMGFNLNHKTVLKLMNELGIHSILRKKRHGKRGKLLPITLQHAQSLLVKKMLEQGLSRLEPTECPIIHSDQGVLYGSAEWGIC